MTSTTLTLNDILAAAERLKGRIERTPCISCPAIAAEVGAASVYLKCETTQRTGAFKERGACNKLLTLTDRERAAGVVTASAGNHGQGVALHAKRLGIKATVCMPTTTPQIKVDRVKSFGAEVCKVGDTFEEARAHAMKLVSEQGMVMVNPYDDIQVMAGQGTLTLEMFEQCPDIDCLVVQVGGGGLAAGMFTAAKSLRPDCLCIAAQTSTFPSLPNRDHLEVKPVVGATTIADGIAVYRAGELTSAALAKLGIHGSDVILVSEQIIEKAIVMLMRESRTVVEGAGATGVAALLTAMESGDKRFAGKHIGIVLSGGNIDPLVFSEVIQRGLARNGSLVRLSLEVADRPGALAIATQLIGSMGSNILDVEHQRTFCSSGLDIKHALLHFVVQTEGMEHSKKIAERLTAAGLRCTVDPISK